MLDAKRWGNGKTRVEFVCGGRVVRQLALARATLGPIAELLRCSQAEVGEAVPRLSSELATARRAADSLLKQLAEAKATQSAASTPAGEPVVAKVEWGGSGAKVLSLALSGLGRTALIASIRQRPGPALLLDPRARVPP